MPAVGLTAQFLDLKQHEVQRKSHFKIQIEGITEELTLHTRTTSLPTRTFETVSTRYFNEVNKQAGARTFNDLPLTVHDAIGLDLERQLNAWQEEIQVTETGVMGYAEDYKRSAIVTEYGINGEIRSQWKYLGVWPSELNFGDLDRDDMTKKTLQMTLSYDKAYLL